jgi:hypothetical protein
MKRTRWKQQRSGAEASSRAIEFSVGFLMLQNGQAAEGDFAPKGHAERD